MSETVHAFTATQNPAGIPPIAQKLAQCLRFPTVSSYDPKLEDENAFEGFIENLPTLFPRLHEALAFERLSTRALLYTWEGSDASLAPALLCAHFDVVPAGDAEKWTNPPFSGVVDAGCVWGRGAQDIKVLLVSALEAAEVLLQTGFKPRRTVLFAFGGDEEVGGKRGAGAIAALLESRGVRASFVLDEGGPIAKGMLSFVERPLGLIGVAEKGYFDVALRAKGCGGHASMPPRRTACGNLARAVAAIEAKRSKARLTKTIKAFLEHLAPASKQPYKALFTSLRFTAPAILAAFGKQASTNALIRTTAAVTMLAGSQKENVLADKAEATVNLRLLPGESSTEALARIRSIVEPHGVEALAKFPDQIFEASAESPLDHEGWRAISAALAVAYPEVLPVPFLFSAGTDTKHYKDRAEAIYRFSAYPQTQSDLSRVHADNERIAIADLERCMHFYKALLLAL